jgi:hypothetical protein
MASITKFLEDVIEFIGEACRTVLADELKGSMFEPLKDLAEFQNVSVDPELETIVWPNGADLAPEFLKALQSKQSQLL